MGTSPAIWSDRDTPERGAGNSEKGMITETKFLFDTPT